MQGFKQFLMRGNVVDLAVGVIIGAAFTRVVSSITQGLLTPLIAAIGGQPDFSQYAFTVHHSVFRYGDLANAVVSFLIVALVLYYMVVLPMNKLAERRARGQEPTPASPSAEAELLTEIRDLLRDRELQP